MADETQNGSPKEIKIPEGDRFLFARIGEKGDLQILFSDVHSAIVLSKLADRWLDLNVVTPSLAPRPAVGALAPGVPLTAEVLNKIRGMKKFGNG